MLQLKYVFISFCNLFRDCIVYFSIQLGRCVLLSFVLLLLVILLRGTVLKRTVFLKGMVWGIFLIAPFLGKLRLFYENMVMCRLFMWWNNICIDFWLVGGVYLLGIGINAGIILGKYTKLHRIVSNMEKGSVCGQEIYINDMRVTPFTTGLVHVKTVIPRTILERFQTDDLQTILLHERIHIRLGHLWCFLLWDILCVLLWLNPFLMICRRFFKEDMEDICDKVTIQKSNKTAYEYGILLLKCIRLFCLESGKLSADFAGEKDFRDMKQRFAKIADFTPYRRMRVTVLAICGMAVLMGLFLVVKQNSYPCYTEEHDIVLMNNAGQFWMLYDSEELRSAFYADGQNVFIDKKLMDNLLWEQGIEEETFFIGFGGYLKIPGIGGGMSFVDVDYSGQNEKLVISYRNNEAFITTIIFKNI